MTVPVKGIDEAGGIDRRKSAKERLWQKSGYLIERDELEQDDSVQISDEARLRASGRHRKSILEHLAEAEEKPS